LPLCFSLSIHEFIVPGVDGDGVGGDGVDGDGVGGDGVDGDGVGGDGVGGDGVGGDGVGGGGGGVSPRGPHHRNPTSASHVATAPSLSPALYFPIPTGLHTGGFSFLSLHKFKLLQVVGLSL
jgi:hypothetical protein